MKKIYAASSLQDAQLLSHALSQAGIPNRLFNEFAQGGLGELPFTHTYPEIWIEDGRDEARARSVITQFEDRPDSVDSIFCRSCHERNPETFETCWHCGNILAEDDAPKRG